MRELSVEGVSIQEILAWDEEYFDYLVLLDKPIVLNIGSAEVLGQFASKDGKLIVDLAQIDGGGEGVLPAIAKVSKHVAKIKNLDQIECVVHALNCAKPNLKLREYLIRTGFEVKEVKGKGEAYFKAIPVTRSDDLFISQKNHAGKPQKPIRR